MLRTMRTFCNKPAEKAGLGEPGVDATVVICWIAAFFSDKIRATKALRPQASQEEIAFHLLDRWGLPLVPWRNHALKASLCKGPDHGIAMMFGVLTIPDGTTFDPVQHIDLAKSTVTLDAVVTNFAMYNYSVDSWPGIRAALCSIPLHHPFWRLDSDLGNEVWAGGWDRTITPLAPTSTLAIDMPLLSVDLWFSNGIPLSYSPLQCIACGKDFNHVGHLVYHCRVQDCQTLSQPSYRGQATPESDALLPDSEQDAIDDQYWSTHRKCPICNLVCTTNTEFDIHMLFHEGQFKCEQCDERFDSQERLTLHQYFHTDDYTQSVQQASHRCDYRGCREAFPTSEELVEHRRVHYGNRKYKCNEPGCGKAYEQRRDLADHMRSHTGEKPFKCTWPGCTKTFGQLNSAKAHLLTHTGEKPFKCEFPGCAKSFATKTRLTSHALTHSGGMKRTIKCTWPTCNKSFARAGQLTRHLMTHTREYPHKCDFDGCKKSFPSASQLAQHRLTHEDPRPHKCEEPGCNKEFVYISSLRDHKDKHHQG